MCTRTTHRYDDLLRSEIQPRDTTSSELTYNRGLESDAPRIVDRPICGTVPEGLTSYGEFGSIIAALFADGGAPMTWSHWETADGRLSAVFAYSIDRAHSNYTVTWCCKVEGRVRVPDQIKTAYEGQISVDPDTGAIVRVTRNAVTPHFFPNHRTDTVVEYGRVEVDGHSYLCPARSVIVAESLRAGTADTIRYANEMVFTGYHKFVANSVLSFGTPPLAASMAAPEPLGHPVAAGPVPLPDCSAEVTSATPRDTQRPATAPLPPPARSVPDVRFRTLRFSPDGQYALAQDLAGIVVLNTQPFRVRFRIPAENATRAEFTPDSRQIVFISSVTHADQQHLAFAGRTARVERWDVADHSRAGFTGIALPTCDSVALSPDARTAVCVDFAGTLRILDVSSGDAIFEKSKFGRPFPNGNGMPGDTGDPGSAQIEFSPDGRFVIVAPLNAMGSALAWDLREKRAVNLTGRLKNLRALSFAFAGAGRLVVSRIPSGWRDAPNGFLVAFPSGALLSKPAIPAGALSRAADPGFVLVRSYVTAAIHAGEPAVRAIALGIGLTITNATAALDVLQNRYVAQRADGELQLYEKGATGGPGSPVELGKLAREDLAVRASGWLLAVATNQIVVRTGDRREVTLHTGFDTKFFDGTGAISPGDIHAGDYVDTESTETEGEEFQAISVRRRAAPTAAPAEEPAAAAQPADETYPAFLQQARQIAMEMSEFRPGYKCTAQVTRYRSDYHTNTLWKQEDLVLAEIAWQDGREEESNATRGGKISNPERVGNRNWSTGDFSTVAADILAPSSGARVVYGGEGKLGESDGVRYLFQMDSAHSHWQVREGGQTIRPARAGTIWFDRKSKRVLRIEFQAVEIPPGFPAQSLELAIDYDYVSIAGEDVLVPVRAEQLGCRRAVAYCTKNTIEFRDYHEK